MMTSDDYENRLRAEYWQLKIRQCKLWETLVKYKAGTLDYAPRCPFDLLMEQVRTMGQYAMILEARAEIQGIDLYKHKE
jgi:hypothetical protein